MMRTLPAFVASCALAALLAVSGCTTRDTPTEEDASVDAAIVIEVDAAAFVDAFTPSCEPGEIECPSGCSRVSGDSNNCGSCGVVCEEGVTCAVGRCDCMAPMLACDGVCLDPSVDEANCGVCGNTCSAIEICVDSDCVLDCDAPMAVCRSVDAEGMPVEACSDLQTDPMNCGTCNTTCSAGSTCIAGRCQCPAGWLQCGRECLDVGTDPANCGSCGISCGADGVCMGGACSTCGTGLAACAGRCTDYTTDAFNCGSCGRRCGSGEACVGGLCECSTGLTDCGAGCLNLLTDPNDCGTCGTDCGAGGVCSAGTCTCAAGLTMCSGSCYDAMTDLTHCGDCDTICPPLVGGVCAAGVCGCPAGMTDCGGVCTRTAYDRMNCGMCGMACADGFTCRMGTCQVGGSFRVTSFGTTGCATMDHATVTGDDRGGIGISPSQVFVSGDTSYGRYSAADLSGGAAIGALHDGIFSNIGDETSYVMLTAAGSQPTSSFGMSATITQLGVLDSATGALTAARIALSMPIPVTYNSGVFSGYDEALIGVRGTSDLQWWHIELPSGVVTRLGNTQNPTHRTCENWAFWGVAETVADVHYAVYVESSTRISRIAIPATGTLTTAAVTPVSMFTNLGDMCSITFSTSRNRWYFHHEYGSQFFPTTEFINEIVGYCAGTWERP